DPRLRQATRVRTWVNGFQQLSTSLKPASGKARERAFQAEVQLSRARNNQVEVEVPGLPLQADDGRRFVVAVCSRPLLGQRLHLPFCGVGEKDEKLLTGRARQALQARPDPRRKGRYTALPAFAEVRLYGPLSDYVTWGNIYDQLQLIKKTIETGEPEGSFNDVVMIYYYGKEVIAPAGHFFLTSESEVDPDLKRSAVNCDEL